MKIVGKTNKERFLVGTEVKVKEGIISENDPRASVVSVFLGEDKTLRYVVCFPSYQHKAIYKIYKSKELETYATN